jgi:molybdate transport system regulatory protein
MFARKSGLTLKVRVWVERDGEKVLGPGRAELLGHIGRLHSIAAAAKQMRMSYRRAWSLVRDINETAGEALVEVTTGGAGGGGAALTPRGKEALRLYLQIIARVAAAAGEFQLPLTK